MATKIKKQCADCKKEFALKDLSTCVADDDPESSCFKLCKFCIEDFNNKEGELESIQIGGSY
jgi:hypothetical protein